MNKKLQEALTFQNVDFVKKFMTRHFGQQRYDEQFFVEKLFEYKWSLPEIVELGNTDLTKLFLESYKSIDINGDVKWSALHAAVLNHDLAHVKLLLDYNANPNILDIHSRVPMFYLYCEYDPNCTFVDHHIVLEIIKILIDRGAKNITLNDNYNVIQVAEILKCGSPEVVKFIFDLGIDLKVQYYDADTVLHHLMENKNPIIITMIRDKDLDVNARGKNQETPLFRAAANGFADGVKFLLSKGVDANAVNNLNCSPIYAATRKYPEDVENYKECIMLLLEHGADVQVTPTRDFLWESDERQTIIDVVLQHKNGHLFSLMQQHLVLQELIGIKINKFIRSKLNAFEEFKMHFDFCKQALTTEVYSSGTLFKLLTCNEEILVRYMRNEEMLKILFMFSDYIKGLYYYHQLLQKRLIKARETATLRKSAGIIISKFMDIDYDCHPLIVDIIISYLECQDLNTLLSL